MDLSVQVFVDRPDGGRDLFDPPSDEEGSAGFDSWRDTVWGSARVRALGAEFFPQLAESDLCVEPGQLTRFLAECALLRDALERLVPGFDPLAPQAVRYLKSARGTVGFESAAAVADFRRTVAQRLANIEAAARYAQAVGGGVLIATAPATAPTQQASDTVAEPLEPDLESASWIQEAHQPAEGDWPVEGHWPIDERWPATDDFDY